MCSRWTATIIWMRFRASAPYRTDRVGRTRSAANGEGALLPKLLIFSRYGQSRCRETIQGVFGADPRVQAPILGFIRMRRARDSAIMPGQAAIKCRTKFAQQCIQIVGFRLEVAWQTLQ